MSCEQCKLYKQKIAERDKCIKKYKSRIDELISHNTALLTLIEELEKAIDESNNNLVLSLLCAYITHYGITKTDVHVLETAVKSGIKVYKDLCNSYNYKPVKN